MVQRRKWVVVGAIALGLACLGGSSAAMAQGQQLQEQLNIRPQGGTQGPARDAADQWMRLGHQERQGGNPGGAIAAWERAIIIYEALGDLASAGLAHELIGLTHAQQTDYGAAEAALRRWLAIAQDTRNMAGQVRAWNNLGTVFIQRGQLTTATTAFETALALAVRAEETGGIGLSLSNLGLAAQLGGDLAEAIKRYEDALTFRLQARDWAGLGNSANNLATLYQRQGDFNGALGLYLLARDAAQRSGDVSNQLRAIDGIITLYQGRNDLERGDPVQVREFLNQRLALTATTAPVPYQQMLSWIRLGDYHRQRQELPAAIAAYRSALLFAQAIGDKPQEAALFNQIRLLERGEE